MYDIAMTFADMLLASVMKQTQRVKKGDLLVSTKIVRLYKLLTPHN